jgi:hypothetical protein
MLSFDDHRSAAYFWRSAFLWPTLAFVTYTWSFPDTIFQCLGFQLHLLEQYLFGENHPTVDRKTTFYYARRGITRRVLQFLNAEIVQIMKWWLIHLNIFLRGYLNTYLMCLMVQRIVVPTHCLLLGDQNRINGNSTGKTSKASWLQKAFPSVGVADLCSHHWIGSVHGTDYHMIPLGLCWLSVVRS